MARKDLLSKEYTATLPASIVTPYEAKVLRMYRTKSVAMIAQQLEKTTQSIYQVFSTIKERRTRHQASVNYWNNVGRDKRLFHRITPSPSPPEEE